ncbi:Na+/H+ antiporter subunit E [Limibaculum sp. M0105]|uniref:Na+/H+ antiporter subunit E n=1 Tax=Thermohalobaculum xanthum TaxID=2753746 RepID=A0A8J7M4K3_9RHOB|nr:Na+/H+ antiporter subunit E [Thermohalobaculum xanthum]MBK0398078.1 Na+/H+ antiporter subunit E [Thermohalobaculum xanthum]
MRLILITLTLFGYWLLLSGHYETWLVVSGGVLAVAVVLFSLFKGITDVESFPMERLPRAALYWPWLGWQMALSAINVSRIILDPKLPISPTMVKVRSNADSAVGIATYANSITLTPGTISVEVSERGRTIWVHAITREGAEGFADDPMNRWVGWFDHGDQEPAAEEKA